MSSADSKANHVTDPGVAPPVKIARRRRSRTRTFLLAAGAFFGTTLIVAIVCEAALWMFAPIPFYEFIEYQPEGHIRAIPLPNQIIRNLKGYEIRINKYGFRGPDYAFEKTPGTLRIAVFGGSAGFCFRASGREKTWPGALERMLTDRLGIPVEVINLSVAGYDVFNSKINYLCFGRAFDPDAIIVYHTWNDLKSFRARAHEPYDIAGIARSRPLWKRIARSTQLGRRGYYVKWNLIKRRAENTYRRAEGTGVGLDLPIDEKAFDWERHNFVDFAEFANHDGVLPVLVSQAGLASPESIEDEKTRFALGEVQDMVGMTLPVMLKAWSRVSAIIEEVAQEHGAVLVDGYGAVPHDLDHFEDHAHLLDAGCEALADAIARTLVEDKRFLSLVHRVRWASPPKAVQTSHKRNNEA